MIFLTSRCFSGKTSSLVWARFCQASAPFIPGCSASSSKRKGFPSLIFWPQEQILNCLIHVFHPRSHGWEGGCFPSPLERSQCQCLPSIRSFKTGPVMSADLLVPLHDPHNSSWASKRMGCQSSFLSGERPSSSQFHGTC